MGAGEPAKPRPKNTPQGVFLPDGTRSVRHGLFESTSVAYYKADIKKENEILLEKYLVLVGAGGFEPPKHYAADLQSVPIGHSGKLPYSTFTVADNLFIIAQCF